MLFLIFDHEIINNKENILNVQSQTLVVQDTTLLSVEVGLEVIVEHIVEIGRVTSLFAESHDALVDLIGDTILSLAHTSHESRDDNE